MPTITIKKFSKQDCRPCSVLASILSDFNFEDYGATLEEIDVQTEEGGEQAVKYGLMGVPVLIFERNGMEVARHSGILAAEELEELIQFAKEAK